MKTYTKLNTATWAGALLMSLGALQAETLFQFGPSDQIVGKNTHFQHTVDTQAEWSSDRLLSDFIPLTPASVTPEVFGGYEIYDIEGDRSVFISHDQPDSKDGITGLNNDSFDNNFLDSLALQAGHLGDEDGSLISYKVGFLLLGELSKEIRMNEDFAITIRMSNNNVSEPTTLRAVIQIEGVTYISSFEVKVGTTSDQTFYLDSIDLEQNEWFIYDPMLTIKPQDEEAVELPVFGSISMAGVLIERPVSTGATYPYFVFTQVAELKVDG